MNENIFFAESQRFNRPWHCILLLCLNGFSFYGILQQVILGHKFGNHPLSNSALLILTTVIFLCSAAVFFLLRLDTQITGEGVQVRFYPFHPKFRLYPWNIISKAFIRKYNPLLDYGGWGVRVGLFGKGKAYNVSGNKGIQLVFTNGSKLLIGTQKEKEAEDALEKIKI